MKQFYILFLAISMSTMSLAQAFTYETSSNIHTELDWDTFSSVDMYFAPNPLDAIQFNWTLISNDMPSMWSYSLCDYTSCYPGIPSNGSMTPITAAEAQNGTQGFFKISLHPGTTEAFATVKIYVYDSNDINVGDTVTFTFNMSDPANVEEEALASISMYPNPANEQVTFSNISPLVSQIEIFNILGEKVETIQPTNSSFQLNVDHYNQGAYFVAYVTASGERRTEKLIVR